MIISASRRTDIPAFYSPWFINRVRAGYCAVPNPYYPSQVSRVSLLPEDVSAFAFSTRNPRPLFPYLDELDDCGFYYYFLITIVGNPRFIDPKSPSLEAATEAFIQLAGRIGPGRTIWRYDPIVLSDKTGPAYHLENFARISRLLSGSTQRCIISIMDDYAKARGRLGTLAQQGSRLYRGEELSRAVEEILPGIVQEASSAKIRVTSCAETIDLTPWGAHPGKCMDNGLVLAEFGVQTSAKKDPGQRKECACAPSRDIGMYDSCLFGCLYCYATQNFEKSALNHHQHDPLSPSLLGWYDAPEKEAPPAQAGRAQLRLF